MVMMNKRILFIGSITRTMKARDILRKNGINATIERRQGDQIKHGCGYGIIVAEGNTDAAYSLLREHGIEPD